MLFELARDLAAMTPRQLDALPIETDLREAIEFAGSVSAHVARKREVQFVAKMMRQRDVEQIQQALAAIEQEARQVTVRHHRVESWRDALLDSGDTALSELMKDRDSSNVQALRHLVRNARKEASLGKPPASARKLFKLLREMDAETALPPVDSP